VRSHFEPFTDVLSEIPGEVTWKMALPRKLLNRLTVEWAEAPSLPAMALAAPDVTDEDRKKGS
jgi:hypothetical protein